MANYVEPWDILGSRLDASIGLRIGIQTVSAALGTYGQAMRSAPTMLLALRCTSYFVVVFSQSFRVDIDFGGGQVILSYQVTDLNIVSRRQAPRAIRTITCIVSSGLDRLTSFIEPGISASRPPRLLPLPSVFEELSQTLEHRILVAASQCETFGTPRKWKSWGRSIEASHTKKILTGISASLELMQTCLGQLRAS